MYQLLKQYWQVGVGIALGAGFLLGAREAVLAQLRTDLLQGALVVVVLLGTTLWFVAYMHATLAELELLHRHSIRPAVGLANWLPLALIVGIATGFGALIAFSPDSLLYSGTALLVTILTSVGTVMVQMSVVLSTRRPNGQLPAPIVDYYLLRPFLLEQEFMLLGFGTAFVLSLIALYRPLSRMSALASLVIVITIGINEYVLFRWRSARDRQGG